MEERFELFGNLGRFKEGSIGPTWRVGVPLNVRLVSRVDFGFISTIHLCTGFPLPTLDFLPFRISAHPSPAFRIRLAYFSDRG